jgi:hypothetical protein
MRAEVNEAVDFVCAIGWFGQTIVDLLDVVWGESRCYVSKGSRVDELKDDLLDLEE